MLALLRLGKRCPSFGLLAPVELAKGPLSPAYTTSSIQLRSLADVGAECVKTAPILLLSQQARITDWASLSDQCGLTSVLLDQEISKMQG
jgi:hypothetical protein